MDIGDGHEHTKAREFIDDGDDVFVVGVRHRQRTYDVDADLLEWSRGHKQLKFCVVFIQTPFNVLT